MPTWGNPSAPSDVSGPLSAYGELRSASLHPLVQVDAVEGVVGTDTEALTATGGSAAAAASLFTCGTGTSVGGYGVIRSRRTGRGLPGQGYVARFDAAFSSPAALGLQIAGAFTATDGLFFGYSGTTPGILRRIAGAQEIRRLTITVGTGGAETVTITLNSVPFTVSISGVESTTKLAQSIAERVGGYTAWSFYEQIGATVTWVQSTPAAAAGTYSISSTGTAAGSFAQIQAGAANDSTTGFVAQTAWNGDRMTAGSQNPSGVTLDWSKLNTFEILYGHGSGAITFRVMLPDGRFTTVHTIQYPNSALVPNLLNPTLRMGWVAASLGSSTALYTYGTTGAIFADGKGHSVRDPYAADVEVTATVTETVALAIRVGTVFASKINQRIAKIHSLGGALETSNRLVTIRAYVNPTLTGTVNWGYVDSTNSTVEVATPSSVTAAGGRKIEVATVPTGSPVHLDMENMDVRLELGDTLVLTVQAASNTAVTHVDLVWEEV